MGMLCKSCPTPPAAWVAARRFQTRDNLVPRVFVPLTSGRKMRALGATIAATQAAGGVGHDLQSIPGEIFPEAHFHLIAELQTSPRADGDVEI